MDIFEKKIKKLKWKNLGGVLSPHPFNDAPNYDTCEATDFLSFVRQTIVFGIDTHMAEFGEETPHPIIRLSAGSN